MFEKFLSENAGDFRNRYQGTYGFFHNGTRPRFLARIEAVDGYVRFVNKDGIPFELNPDNPDEVGFHFLPPNSVYYNTVEGAIYPERKAAKQFSRGVSERNLNLYQLNEKGFRTVPVNFKYLSMVYDSGVTVKTALKNFFDGKVQSVAISPQFAVNRTHIFVLGTECGTVEIKGCDLHVTPNKDSIFKTEIFDAMSDIGCGLVERSTV